MDLQDYSVNYLASQQGSLALKRQNFADAATYVADTYV